MVALPFGGVGKFSLCQMSWWNNITYNIYILTLPTFVFGQVPVEWDPTMGATALILSLTGNHAC